MSMALGNNWGWTKAWGISHLCGATQLLGKMLSDLYTVILFSLLYFNVYGHWETVGQQDNLLTSLQFACSLNLGMVKQTQRLEWANCG